MVRAIPKSTVTPCCRISHALLRKGPTTSYRVSVRQMGRTVTLATSAYRTFGSAEK